MPHLLFRLRNVPEDEAEDIRRLLNEQEIEFYETTSGNWGISMPGIWLKSDERLAEARELIDHYEYERSKRVRSEYAQLHSEGRQRTLFDLISENPLRFILYLAGVLLVLYLSTIPLLNIGQ